MSRAGHITIVLAMTVHMMLGCCWHHAHGACFHGDDHGVISADSCCRQSCHQSVSKQHDQGDGDSLCKEGRCTFNRQDTSEAGELVAALHYISLDGCLPPISMFNGIDTAASAFSHFQELVPLHLLNQALLL